MKIAMFTDSYLPQTNGVATSVYLYKRALERMGHEVYIVSPIGPKDETVLVLGGIQFKWEKNLIIPSSGRILPIIDFVKKKQIDVIHSHAPFALGFRALIVQRRLFLPHVHTYHTLLVEYRHYIPRPLTPSAKSVEEFSSWFCNMTNQVIAPTEKIKLELLRYGVTKPVHVVPTGIDVELFEKPNDFDIKKRHSIQPKAKVLLFVGRLAKEKNVTFILRVFKILLEKKYDVHLIVVGDGPERNALQQLAKDIKVDHRVIFTGCMPRTELANYYRQADLFVFGSQTETQGLVVLEALAASTPVVAVAKMGIADVLKEGKGALLTKEASTTEFVEKVEQILSDESLAEKLRLEGKKYILHYWSIDSKAKLIGKIYETAVEEGACFSDFKSNIWLELMVEKMRGISAKIFESTSNGGARRAAIKRAVRTHRR
ncbi:glycosyltransferase family 4 protein [Pseudothermotoga sp.]|uniref:glycosyltransferase family 4 protein n=1 Tax=Pseudothermotoga sp. TaxID=2033661 RepID=UPI002586D410|nr:glycosyltransferase family 4 protein [Pseudothermotoga sp.]MDK2884081.1 1,2-diacylglycerol 3-alpha-glucosyltransferase [Pseudothermotoga sp.]